MKKLVLALATAVVLITTFGSLVVQAQQECPEGTVWNPDTQKCEEKSD